MLLLLEDLCASIPVRLGDNILSPTSWGCCDSHRMRMGLIDTKSQTFTPFPRTASQVVLALGSVNKHINKVQWELKEERGEKHGQDLRG